MAVEAWKDGEGRWAVQQQAGVPFLFPDCWSKRRSAACTGFHLKRAPGPNAWYRHHCRSAPRSRQGLAAASDGAHILSPPVNGLTRKGESENMADATARPRASGDIMVLLPPPLLRRRACCLHFLCYPSPTSCFGPCVPPRVSCSRALTIMKSGRPKVLLVEDMEINRMLVRRLATELDLILEEAENGQVAVEYCRQGRLYDIILMDRDMPVMDGHEATRQLRDLRVTTPIVALSSASLQSDQDLFIQAGANDFQAKPLTKQELIGLLAKYVVKRD